MGIYLKYSGMDLAHSDIECQLFGCEDAVAKVRWADRLCADLPAALVLNTCQRLEVYGTRLALPAEAPVTERFAGTVAVERLARIAAGLESRIPGEFEVLGQVRAAYKRFRAHPQWHASPLDALFQKALAAARQARRKSGIDQMATSVAALAVHRLTRQIAPGESVAVIGTGSLAGSVARRLAKQERHPIKIASRCPVRAGNLAGQLGACGASLSDLVDLLEGVSAVITATGAPHPVLRSTHVANSRRPLYIVDLSVPRDCHPELDEDPSVIQIPLESIEGEALINMDERRQRAAKAAAIIAEAVRG